MMHAKWMLIGAIAAALSGCYVTTAGRFSFDDSDGSTTQPDAATSEDAGERHDGGRRDAGPIDAGSDPDASPSPDATPGCPPATHRCLPRPGEPWAGPFAVSSGAGSCGGTFPDPITDLFGALDVPLSTCTCMCSGTPTVSCFTGLRGVGYSSPDCISPAGFEGLGPNECWSPSTLSPSVSLQFERGPNASCTPGAVSPSIPAAEWGERTRVCGGFVEGGSCGGAEVCIPSPPSSLDSDRHCVVAPGDVPCPSGYDVGRVLHTGLTDTRSCPSTCGCSASGARCSVVVDRYTSSTTCSGTTTTTIEVFSDTGLECLGNTASIRSVRPRSVAIADRGACAPNPAAPPILTGAATPTGPHTLCCTN